ncbi:MAG: ABC transporter permease [Acidobacteriota bacterium]|nr:ABC transporter permease [Acidobacteriota bacterium]
MSPYDVLRFAAGALRGHSLRTVLSVLGVTIGVASVILLTSLGEGARLYVTGEFSNLGTNLLIVVPGKIETTGMVPFMGGAPNDLTIDDVEAVRRRVPGIRYMAPLAMGEAPARYGDRTRDVQVVGTTPEMQFVRVLSINVGRYLPESDPDRGPRVCVIGSKIQRELFPGLNPLGETLKLGEESFRVIGVMTPRGRTIGMDMDEFVHVPVGRAMRMFDQTTLWRIFVEVGSFAEIDSVKDEIIRVLTERHDDTEDVTILTQDSVLSTFSQIMAVLTAALGGIAAISLSVAGVGIMNVMLVSVSERTSEIGLLKALGGSAGQVLLVFLVEAAVLSTIGGLLGLSIGLGAGRIFGAVYPAFPVEPPMWAVGGSLVLSITLGVAFGALPARRAARLDPVLALARR